MPLPVLLVTGEARRSIGSNALPESSRSSGEVTAMLAHLSMRQPDGGTPADSSGSSQPTVDQKSVPQWFAIEKVHAGCMLPAADENRHPCCSSLRAAREGLHKTYGH